MELKTKTVELKADGDGYIVGYASTWTKEPDAYNDIVAKGAFAESIERIKAEGKAIPLLWNHDSGDLKSYIGTVTELAEDDHGLLFTATFDATEEAQRARELASDGRLCKFSFAYNILDQGTVTLDDGTEANELRKLDLFEVSLVMYPANPDTSVVEVKSDAQAGGLMSVNILANGIDEADAHLIGKALAEAIDRKQQAAAEKAGRRNSAKDADALREVLSKMSDIQSIVNGLLADELPDEQEPEAETDGAKANAEEPTEANAEEPQAKSAETEALLEIANTILERS
jgi:HK97 family phage prohead protease